MGLLFGWVPSIVKTAAGTLAVGLLAGYLGSAAAGSLISDRGWFATTGESPEARAFMVAFLQREPENVQALRAARDVVTKALAQQASQNDAQQLKPLSLTYLGGSNSGPLSVQVYAVEARAPDGTQGLLTYAVTLLRGKVIDIR